MAHPIPKDEHRILLLKKMAAVRADVGYMQKEGQNTMQHYKFLSERQITEKFKELFEKHGLFFFVESKITSVQNNASGKQILTNVDIQYKFVDIETGEEMTGQAAGQGTDANDKGVYKAITGAIKYVFMKNFLIPTGDDPEDDSHDAPKGTRARAASEEYGTSYGKGVVDQDKPPFGPGSEEED
jgi:hypothetical protein